VLTRRAWLQAMLAAGAVRPSLAQDAALPDDPEERYRDFMSGALPDLTQLGTDPPTAQEIKIADALIAGAPKSTPIAIFAYLEARKEQNRDKEWYNGGWKTRWNPLIVRFFEQTKTTPSGDTTAWCAASLNWTLARSGLWTSNSASSGSFRSSPGATSSPVAGDIVVFRATDDRLARAGRGHVGIVLDRSSGQVKVLGGNQRNRAGHHAVCSIVFTERGKQLTLHSYHALTAFTKKP
jgi:uncharacterized protein (TIGR02594 family)